MSTLRNASRTWFGLSWCLAAAAASAQSLPVGDGPNPSRAERRAYGKSLDGSRHLPKIRAGAADRRLVVFWRAPAGRVVDHASDDTPAQRQLADATCDADLVVIGHVTSAQPFPNANRRWILTAHDLVVTTTVRSKLVGEQPARVRYLHPSGSLTIGTRTVSASLDRFPPLTSDEEHLFFLVRLGNESSYRASLAVPLLAIRGGVLQAELLPDADPGLRAIDGLAARQAARFINATVCRPEPRTLRPPDTPRDEFLRAPPG